MTRKLSAAQRRLIDASLERTSGGNGETSKRASVILHHRVVEVARLVDEGGAVEMVAEYREMDRIRAGKRRGGPKPSVSVRQALILYKLLALEGKAASGPNAAKLLMGGLSAQSLEFIGLDPKKHTLKQWSQNIWGTIDKRFLKPVDVERLDPAVGGDRRRRQVRRNYDAMRARLDPDVEAEKLDRLHRVMNQLLDPTIDLVPSYILDPWEGHTGLDATPVDFDVHHGNRMRDKTPDDMMAVMPNGNYYKDTRRFGADLHLVVAVPNKPYANDEMPRITVGVSFAPCGTRPGEVGLKAYESLHERRFAKDPRPGRRLAILDGGYFPNPKPESFQNPLRALGIDPVGTYGKSFIGIKGSYRGYLLVEGDTVCPYTPKPLVNAAVDFDNKTIDHDTFHDRLSERAHYASRTHETRANGDTREKCPAVGPGRTVNCPHCPSANGKNDLNLPTVNPGPKAEVCGKTTVVPVEITGKYRQGLRWKTPEHRARFASIRSTNEGVNGHAKRDSELGLHIPGDRKLRSLAGQFFQSTLVVIAANFHRIDAHLRNLRDGTVPPAHPERRNGWKITDDEAVTADPGTDQDANAPPTAA